VAGPISSCSLSSRRSLRAASNALDVFVAGTLFKEDNYFAVRALPGVAGLYPFGPVAKRGFAPGAMNLNGFIHVPAFNEA
jgi:hypothetical protein